MKIYRSRILEFESKNGIDHYLIPYDLNIKKYEIRKVLDGSIILENRNRDKDDFYKEIILYKRPFNKEYYYKNKKIKISLIYENHTFQKAINILVEEHYISNIPSGLYFSLEYGNELIGVLVMSKLVYTNAVGRKIYLKEKFETDDEIKDFALKQIAWISRIAITKKSQANGIGNFFISKLPEIVFQIYPNKKLKYIEILTSWTLKKLKDLKFAKPDEVDIKNVTLPEKKDFLCKKDALYERVELPDKTRYSIQKRKIIDKFGKATIEKVKIMKFYYVKQLK